MVYGGDSKLYLGDRIKVRTMLGDRGNVIGQLPDGRTILFGRDSPYRGMLAPSQEVECHVVHIAPNYIIVEPIMEPAPISEVVPSEVGRPEIGPPQKRAYQSRQGPHQGPEEDREEGRRWGHRRQGPPPHHREARRDGESISVNLKIK